MPDISGFTEFVNKTEIEHGQHIISELLEIIIAANELKMIINEIEGDAILFYKLEEIPSYDQLLKQAVKIFTDFHLHLKKYEHDRICDCGACAGANSLSLKIVTHTGELGFTTVNKQKKLYGKDMIVVHKLLKNDIGQPEYLLFSDDLAKKIQNLPETLNKGSTAYEKIGDVNYRYLSLSPFLENIKYIPTPIYLGKVLNPLRTEIEIDKPIKEVYELLTNLKYRTSWNEGLDELIFDEYIVNREGTKHQCVVNEKLIDFETIRNDFSEGEMGFGERLLSVPQGMKTVVFYYILTSNVGGSTKLTHEIHLSTIPVIGWLIKPFISRFFSKSAAKSLAAFKKFCEELD